ncbi:MAG: lipopolysaccharide heptosyltransferase II [Burkholderiaceae bacterium]|nr:lipopolysaccharide heptosyltransferase II [Burkholderiaceae bacterium]
MSASALVIAPNWIGEAVMAQPLLALLRQRDPSLRIDALCAPRTAPVFRAMPEVSEVIDAPEAGRRLSRAAAVLRLGWRLRARDYRRSYVLGDAPGAALAAVFAGIPERIGHRGDAHCLLLNRVHEPAEAGPLPRVEHYARLAFAPREPLPGQLPAPRLARCAEAERAARARFGLTRDAPLIVLCPGAEQGPARRWPTRHYAALAALLADEWPEAQLVLLGSARERPIATEIAALSGQPVRNLAGETGVDDAIAIVAQAAGIVSGDTGLMHLAAAFGRPQVAVFGATDPRHTPPRSPRAHVEWLHLDCSPCFGHDCALGHLDCLNRIAPAAVFDSLSKAMRFETASTRPVR